MPYPSALDDLDADLIPGSGANADVPLGEDGAGAYTHPAHHAAVATAVEAIEAKLGIGSSAPAAQTVLAGTDVGETGYVTYAALASSLAPLLPGLQKATVTLSSADILALDSTPITLVAAPGAGSWLLPHRIVVTLLGVGTPYTVADSAFITGGMVWLDITGLLGSGSDASTVSAATFANGSPVDLLDNTALRVLANDAVTLGDGTLTVTVWYSVEDVP